ncbi:MAG: hypothetical protein EOO01_13025 [Chitinophagaceae bacterium]|nr:MAG: hypothetical protein EOO01_13025 [Chitinophagaceae bacterium]
MENTTIISGKEIDFNLHPGAVIHANKYAEASGGWGSLPVQSTLNTEVVVRLTNGEDIRLYIRHLDLPVYNGQEVSLLAANGSVVALVDLKTRRYYYTTHNFQKKLGMDLPAIWVWIIGIALGAVIYLINNNGATWVIAPLLVWIPVLVNRWMFNSKMRKQITSYLGAG